MQKEVLLEYPRPVHRRRKVPQEHVWHRSHRTNMSWDGQIDGRKPHAPPSLQKKFVCTETIDGFVRTQLVPIRCQFGIDLISSKHCSTLRQLKNKEDAAHQQRWQSYSSSWWNWKESWWHSSYGHHNEDGPSPDWSGKPVEKWLGYLFEAGFLDLIWCSTVQNSITANSSLLSPTGV